MLWNESVDKTGRSLRPGGLQISPQAVNRLFSRPSGPFYDFLRLPYSILPKPLTPLSSPSHSRLLDQIRIGFLLKRFDIGIFYVVEIAVLDREDLLVSAEKDIRDAVQCPFFDDVFFAV